MKWRTNCKGPKQPSKYNRSSFIKSEIGLAALDDELWHGWKTSQPGYLPKTTAKLTSRDLVFTSFTAIHYYRVKHQQLSEVHARRSLNSQFTMSKCQQLSKLPC